MGGLVGGRVGRISNSVRPSYWSLDTNNGRAKEDLVCWCVPPPPLLLSCSGKSDGICRYPGCTLWGGPVHLEDRPVCLSSIRPSPLFPTPPYRVRWDLNYIWTETNTSHISHQLDETRFRQSRCRIDCDASRCN